VGVDQLAREARHLAGQDLDQQVVDRGVARSQHVEPMAMERERLGLLERDDRRRPLVLRDQRDLAEGVARAEHGESRGIAERGADLHRHAQDGRSGTVIPDSGVARVTRVSHAALASRPGA
jgi:hypothetical protein